MKSKYHRICKKIKHLVLWIIICFLFVLLPPERLGLILKEYTKDTWSKVSISSLFFELNPFLRPNNTYNTDLTETDTWTNINAIDTQDTSGVSYDDIYVNKSTDNTDIDSNNPSLSQENTITFRNETDFEPCVETLLNAKPAFTITGNTPNILIIHTHTSESYTPDDIHPYIPSDTSRTLDSEFNVVRIGTHLANRLRESGIEVVHDKTIHDYPSYSGSYARTLDTIKSNLQMYPDISVVIDIHRDAIIDDDGTNLKTFCLASRDGQTLESAELMLVVGTDKGGMDHLNWESNLSFAVKLQDEISKLYPKLMRPINLRNERFNQHATVGSLILEVGSSGNTLSEALNAIDLFADGFILLLDKYKN